MSTILKNVKLNVAWKYFRTRQSMGVGSIVRDRTGAILAAHSEEFTCVGDAISWAASSLLKALQFGLDAGFQRVVVEFTDAQLKVLIISKDPCLTELHELLCPIRAYQNHFSFLHFKSVPRVCNKAAKLLASYAKENNEPSSWFEEGPTFILPSVLADLS